MKEISSLKYIKKSYHKFFFPEIRPLIEKMKINTENEETNSKEEDEEYDSSENYSDDDDTKIDPDFYQTRDFKN